MANQTISNPLKRAIAGGHIATVDDIAFSTKQEGSAPYTYETIDVSLKEKIESIISDANALLTRVSTLENKPDGSVDTIDTILYPEVGKDNQTLKQKIESLKNDIDSIKTGGNIDLTKIEYSYTSGASTITSNLKDTLDNIRSQISAINSLPINVDTIVGYVNDAQSAKNNSEKYSSYSINGFYINSQGTIVAWKKGDNWVLSSDDATIVTPSLIEGTNTYKINDSITNTTFIKGVLDTQSDYNNLQNIANEIKNSFDSEAKFIICSKSYYNNLTSKIPGTLYLCYD